MERKSSGVTLLRLRRTGCVCDSGGSKQMNTHSSQTDRRPSTRSHTQRKSGLGGTFTANAV